MQQFSRIVARNTAAGMLAQAAIKLLSFGFSVLIARQLGAETYGQYAAVMAFWGVFVFVADLGLSPYTVRQVARVRDAEDGQVQVEQLYGNVLGLRFLLALLAAALVMIAAWITRRPPVMIGAIALGTLIMLSYSVHGAAEAVLSGYERLDITAQARVINQLIFVLAGALVLWAGAGYYGLIIASLLGVSAMTYACWRGAKALGMRPRMVGPRGWPMLLRASIPFGLIGFTLGLSYKFDSVLLNIFRGDAETGYYNAAYGLVFSTVMLSNVINTSLYPSLTRQAVNGSHALPAIYERALGYLMLIALPIAVGGVALAGQIVPFLFDTAYLPAVPALRIVMLVVPLMFASEFLGYVVLIAGKEHRVARAIIVSTGFNISANLLLVPIFGYVGAAIMTVITEAVLVGQYVWMLRAEMRAMQWGRVLVRPAVAALLMGLLALALSNYLPLLLNVALSGLAYVGLLLALGVLGADELRFVRGLRQSAREKLSP